MITIKKVADFSQYMWGKSVRKDSARAALAIAQAVDKTKDVIQLFSEPFGFTLSESATPAIFNIVHRGIPSSLTLPLSF